MTSHGLFFCECNRDRHCRSHRPPASQRPGSAILFAITLLFAISAFARGPALTDVKCYPSRVTLDSAKATQRLVLQATFADGSTKDLSAQGRYRILNSKLARFKEGVLTPIADGQTELQIAVQGKSLSLPIVITNAAAQPAVSFQRDVMPVFLKAGCNAGACHGSSRGKDGFRLSLFGFDPEGDYFRLTREQIGRRVNLAIPQESLIVQKGLGAVQHTGGVRFNTNSPLCQRLIGWLAAGAPKDPAELPRLTGIEIFPKGAVLTVSNSFQHFIVRGQYADGKTEDLTPLTVFLSNNDLTARLGEDGLVVAGQRGEAFIQARFAQFNVGAQVIVVPANATVSAGKFSSRNYVDEAVYAKLQKMRLEPSAQCDDATFIRRASLDITGALPRPEEIEAFAANTAAQRREQLVDTLLERKEFAELWVMKFAELLEIRSRDNRVSPKAAVLYFEWLRDQMLNHVGLDKIVQNLVTASDSNFRNPPANYYQMEPDTLKLAENTAQAFMGMRIQCAQCHNHPFDRWTMNDYYGFAAFFSQIGRKPGDDPRETVVYDRPEGEMKNPVTGAVLAPRFLGGDVPDLKGKTRREVLAQWLVSPENPYFARNLANLIWSHFLGRGIVEPVDDMRISNPPSNPELLDVLASKLVEYHYDFKKLVKDICLSNTYQTDPRANRNNASDDRNFSKATIRRIRAEVLLDCISQVTETQDKFPGLPRGAKAVEIADGNSATYFLTTFGRASRATVCSCEVKTDPNLSQALHLLNGDTLQNKIEQGGVIKRLIKRGDSNATIIDNLYLRCFSRKPTSEEFEKLQGFIEKSSGREKVLGDIFWSLLNAKEFVFNH